MKRSTGPYEKGFTLLEIMVVLAIIGALATITLPHYVIYREKSMTAAFQSNRRHIEMDELANYLDNKTPSTTIDARWKCPSGGTYVWLVSDPQDPDYPTVGCSIHFEGSSSSEKPRYAIDLAPDALDTTIREIFSSFSDYVTVWIAQEGRLPRMNDANASSSWNSTDYTGTDPTNLFMAKFWDGYYRHVDVDGFNAENEEISDFKVFFQHNGQGDITSEIAGVYLQVGPERRIYFSNGVTVEKEHYKTFIDKEARELVAPPSP